MSTSNHEALADLLLDLFSSGELRRFLRYGERGEEFEKALPEPPASPAAVAEEAVKALVKRGLVNDGFWTRLHKERPGRASDIDRVRVLFRGTAPAPPPETRPAPAPSTGTASNHEPAPMPTAPKVFISYAHDSDDHRQRVRALSDQLRKEGIDCQIDQYVVGSPPEGWPLWMERMIDWADFALVTGSERYIARYELREPAGVGKGATWEGAIVRIDLYETQGRNAKFVPVLFDGKVEELIPKVLRAHTHYRLLADYDGLYRVLTQQPAVVAPGLGGRRVLPTDPR